MQFEWYIDSCILNNESIFGWFFVADCCKAENFFGYPNAEFVSVDVGADVVLVAGYTVADFVVAATVSVALADFVASN